MNEVNRAEIYSVGGKKTIRITYTSGLFEWYELVKMDNCCELEDGLEKPDCKMLQVLVESTPDKDSKAEEGE